MSALYALVVFLAVSGQDIAFTADAGLTMDDCNQAKAAFEPGRAECRPVGTAKVFMPVPQRKPVRR